jgi:hypothetical protein
VRNTADERKRREAQRLTARLVHHSSSYNYGRGLSSFRSSCSELVFSSPCQPPPAPEFAPGDAQLLSTNSPTKDEDPSVLRAQDGRLIVAWFSDRGRNADIYLPLELAPAGVEQYPPGVVENTLLLAGYSHCLAATGTDGVCIGVWTQGPDGAQDIFYRFFE